MQTRSPKIWTHLAVSISFDGIHNTTNTAKNFSRNKELLRNIYTVDARQRANDSKVADRRKEKNLKINRSLIWTGNPL